MDDSLLKSMDIGGAIAEELRKLSQYGLIGLGSNVLLYIAFIGLLRIGLSPIISASICYIAGVVVSYLLNRRWTFESSANHLNDLPKFLSAYALGLASTLGTITVLLHFFEPEIAQILNVAITAMVVYASLRALRFGIAGVDSND